MTQQQEGPTWSPEPGPAPYAAPAPQPPAGPAAPAQLPFGLTPDDLTGALRTVGRSLVPVLGGLTVLVAAVALIAAPDGHGGSLADWLRTAVLLLALSFGGRAVVDGSVGIEEVGAELAVGLRVLPLVVTVVALALVARANTAAERQTPSTGRSHLLARSLVTGLVAGVGLAIAVALSRTTSAFGADIAEEFDGAQVEIGAGALGALLGATVLVTVVAAVARARVAGPLPLPAALAAYRTPERAAGVRPVLATLSTFLLGLLAASAVGIAVTFLYRAFLTDDLDGGRWQALGALVVLGVNAVLVAALTALGVPLGVTASGRGDADVLDFVDDVVDGGRNAQWTLFDSKVWLLLLLVPLAVALATAVRRSLRRPGAAVGTSGLKTAAVIGAVAGLVAALLVRVSAAGAVEGSAAFVGEVSASAALSAGPSLLWAPLLGAAWAAFAVWVLRFGPTLALSLPPRLARALAGRDIAPEWAAALAGTAPAPAGTRSSAVRLGAVGAGALLVLGALGAAVVTAVNATVFSPQAAAEEYLDALADRDVAAVLDQLAEAPDAEGQLFLTEQVVGSEDYSPISDVSVGDVTEYGDAAEVDVSYSIDGQPFTESLPLVAGDARFGLFDTWEVATTLPTVSYYAGGELGAQVAGAELTQESYVALPGGYVAHAAEHPLLTSAPSRFMLTMDQSNSPSMDPTVKPQALSDAEDAIEERLAECAASTSVPLTNCPFLSYWSSYSGDLSDVRMEVVEEPQYSLEYDSYDGVLDIVTESRGELRLTGTLTDTSWTGETTVEPYEDEFTFTMSGDVSGTGGDLQVGFDD
ncbi:hypothetical protein O2W14_16555 [Modestobacter sp. VKM Ac-2986]|uniref:hypothetical protein n=1 Tax=Modestobacter sp. VKM Ac-2986 TaxID=3004140 RepID=UPI0022AB89A3|nr:hypothetical protein [Modestobacter sp. VKM Ac-2986]MCZ2830450.1 hypothetical protein [Modestobacter sp. VKM Ac-2986]